jgi:site-specific DNA-methyltransferase (adenine-specific)
LNRLYYGDNLDILRRYVKDEPVGLIYLDSPFNSKQDYNVRFKENTGSRSASQIKAFTDTWHWEQAAPSCHEVVRAADQVAKAINDRGSQQLRMTEQEN